MEIDIKRIWIQKVKLDPKKVFDPRILSGKYEF